MNIYILYLLSKYIPNNNKTTYIYICYVLYIYSEAWTESLT